MEGNRLCDYEKIEKPFQQPLPAGKYEFTELKETKVHFNYHVDYEGFFYSVPYTYAGLKCSIRATSKTIEIYVSDERIAVFSRNHNPYKRYTTLPDHMPEGHKAVSGWSPERFLSWAKTIGPNTQELIKHVLESREYPVQTYRACMGIMRLSKSYTPESMEKASEEALTKRTYTYKYFSIILKQVTSKAIKAEDYKIIQHANVRGSRSYVGGGITLPWKN
jgi:hypothetical protein